MKSDSLSSLYRETMDNLSPSADPGIEELRRRWAKGELREPKVSPEYLQELTGSSEEWSTHAFRDLERSGFFVHNYRHFLWRDPSRQQTALALDSLAGVEIAVLMRAGEMDMTKVQSELDRQHSESVRAAEGRIALPALIALQRYFTTLVMSIGNLDLMSKYARLNSAWVCYAWAHHFEASDVEDLADWMLLIPEVLTGRDPGKTAHLCQAIKCLPFGAQLPDLAVA